MLLLSSKAQYQHLSSASIRPEEHRSCFHEGSPSCRTSRHHAEEELGAEERGQGGPPGPGRERGGAKHGRLRESAQRSFHPPQSE